MPRIIPADIYSACPSPGEKELFLRLKNSPSIDDWTILHSLDLANHVRGNSGEADFVIIAPRLGVLCVEVKACKRLRRDDHGWWYGNESRADPRGPFRQASEAMHSIRHRIARACPHLSHIICWSAVVFPYLEFDVTSSEWHDWQVIDAQRLRSRPLPDLLRAVLTRARMHVKQKGNLWHRDGDPSPTQVTELAELLRPSFEVYESPKARGQQIESELKKYTSEQFRALDALATNPRVLYQGPAGTGKTLLAIEAARRSAAVGKRVLFLCFNRLLSQWLAEQMSPMRPQVAIVTLHRYMLDVCGLSSSAAQKDSKFWEVQLPQQALRTMLGAESLDQYDELVVDEAQDILRADYLDVLDVSLRGGLAAGNWRFLGDFEKQTIYGNSGGDPKAMLRERAAGFVEYSLRENCRNPPRIACLARLLGRLAPDYSRVLRPDNGIEPNVLYYQDEQDQRHILAGQMKVLRDEGLRADEIVVLSGRADQHSCAASLSGGALQLRTFAEKSTHQVGFCSIHAFKGREARVVILTDIEELSPSSDSDIFYTGITRAVDRLTILIKTSARANVVNALLSRRDGQTEESC